MNICFYCNFNGGGTERAAANLAKYLKLKYDVFMLTTSKVPATYPVDDITLDHLECGSILKQIVSLSQYLKNNRIDVLVALEALSGITAIPAAKMAKCKLVIWEHANYYQNQGSKYTTQMRKVDLLLADAYVLLTKRDYYNFETHFKIPKNKVQQIYNIADFETNCSYDLSSKTIISAGHIRKIKNFRIIPEIGRLIFSLHPDWCWKIYGRNEGDEYESIHKRIIEYGLESNILFVGRKENMIQEYEAASMYVLTSLMEGLPMVLLEAKSCGLPLVSFDIETGPDEIIQDGINGFLVPPYDVTQMAGKICQLIENEELRKRFSDNSDFGLEKFSADQIVVKWDELLQSLKG